MKTTEEKGVGVGFLVRTTLKVGRACWSSKMGTRTNNKQVSYSYGPTQTKQQVGKCIIGTLLVHGKAMGIHGLTKFTMV